MSVKLRYVELEPDRIFNWLNPMNITCWGAYPEWHDTWWEPSTVEKRERFGEIWTEEFDKITGHFSKLEESILKDGIHHPVSVVSGITNIEYFNVSTEMFPPNNRNERLLHSRVFGGSRLTIAKKYNIKVPCLVHDYSGIFNDNDKVTHNNYKQWFSDNYMFSSQVPYIRLKKHSHLTGEYDGMNSNTKKAQNQASNTTKEIMNV